MVIEPKVYHDDYNERYSTLNDCNLVDKSDEINRQTEITCAY